MTTHQICIAAKGEINLQNKPANGATVNLNTGAPLKEVDFYTVFSHPAPLDDPTPSATTPGSSLAIKRNADGSLTLTWTGSLQSADTVNGTYQAQAGSSPLTSQPSATAKFYRAR